MGTSDLDEHTFAQRGPFAIGVKAHCPLNAKPPTVETACLSTAAEVKALGEPMGSTAAMN
jgi:hypothetical protein